jgi:hypothetical protein
MGHEGKTVFRVIDGGRSTASGIKNSRDRLRTEGKRRLSEADYEWFEARERVTGIEMPTSLRHFQLQIEFAISALSQLQPLPVDYMLDSYWPAYKERATHPRVARTIR